MATLLNTCKMKGCTLKVRKHYDSYCPKHLTEKTRLYDTTREHALFYNSRQWKAIKTQKLNASPLCERCLSLPEKRITPAAMVHHRVSLDRGGAPFSIENLESLCYPCHGILTAELMKGKG